MNLTQYILKHGEAPKPGTQVAIARYYGGSAKYTFATVTSCTPTGKKLVARCANTEGDLGERVFTNGREKTFSSSMESHLEFDVESVRRNIQNNVLRRNAADALNKITMQNERVRETYGKDYMQKRIDELKALLADAEDAVAQIPDPKKED